MGWGEGGEREGERGGRGVSRNTCSTFAVSVREEGGEGWEGMGRGGRG